MAKKASKPTNKIRVYHKEAAASSCKTLPTPENKRKRYVCPNCGEDKPTIRGKCPYCGVVG